MRLMDGGNASTAKGYGRVEVCWLKVWGSVCQDGFDDNDAAVVCR